jgi:membrane protein DedA with SNARE-associated domain
MDITILLNDFASFLGPYSAFLPYFIIFFVFTACGVGLLIPEDIVLIAAGVFVYHDLADLYVMIIISLAGIIFGDFLIFSIGRKWGIKFLNHRIFMNAFSEKRMAKVHKYFDKYGNKTIFFARFFLGLRATTFFIAGTHTIKAMKFIILDLLGALISIPLIIYLAYYFGNEIEKAISTVKHMNHTLLLVIILLIIFFVIKHSFRKRENP